MKTMMAASAALLICMVGLGSASVASSLAADSAAKHPVLDREKLRAEVRKLTIEREKLEGDKGTFWRLAPYMAPILTAAIAGLGLFITTRKAGQDRLATVVKEAEERETAAGAAEIVRFDERFANAVTGLSSAKPDDQRGAAVLIASMVREKRRDLSDQALQLLLVALQSQHDSGCEKILTVALGRFIRAAPVRLLATENGVPVFGLARIRAADLDLSRLKLPGLDLAFATLHGADLREATLEKSKAYRADLSDAKFTGAKLTRAEWVEVSAPRAKFQHADLGRARLFRADLSRANFYRADLRSANLRHSDLEGARFEKANVLRTDFFGAALDDVALRSLREADGWEGAIFDEDALAKLKRLG